MRSARWYQDYIDREELADEMDLAQVAVRLIQTTKSSRCTLIICDEVQDFTEIQLELLIGSIAIDPHRFGILLDNPSNIFPIGRPVFGVKHCTE